jgi:hypothetical protein
VALLPMMNVEKMAGYHVRSIFAFPISLRPDSIRTFVEL